DDGEIPWDGESMGELLLKGPWIADEYYKDERSDKGFHDGYIRKTMKNGPNKINDTDSAASIKPKKLKKTNSTKVIATFIENVNLISLIINRNGPINVFILYAPLFSLYR